MLARISILALPLVLLAACGEDQQQTARDQSPPAGTTAAREAPANSPANNVQATPPPPERRSAEVTSTPAPGMPSTEAGKMPAGPTLADLHSYMQRTYASGPVTLRLNNDNTFVMRQGESGPQVEGRYAYQDGIITFSDPKGDTGSATFPMRCRFDPVGAQFRLLDQGGSCAAFADATFKPAPA